VGADVDGETAEDWSGYSVALSSAGSRVAIGAPLNDGSGPDSGHVRVYEWSGGAWVQVGADIDGEVAGDWSGYSVALSSAGSRVAIGAIYNDGSGHNAGQVRVYEWSGSAWVQLGADIHGEAFEDWSGLSVALSSAGSRVAIGAPCNNGHGSDAGQVRVYEWSGSAWVQVGADVDGETAEDWSGYSVALSSAGSRVAIGAPLNDGSGTDSGHVRVYEWSGGAWVQLGADIDGEAAEDYSGYSVALSSAGNRVAIGAPQNGGNGHWSGQVRVYEWNDSAWVQVGTDIDGEAAEDYSGFSVALAADGSRVAIGAAYNSGIGNYAGQVRVYDWSGSAWVQAGADIHGEAAEDYSGYSVALAADGSRLAIGAPYNDGNGDSSGHVRMYGYELLTPTSTPTSTWTATATSTATNTSTETPTNALTPTATTTPSPSVTPTPTETPTATPTPAVLAITLEMPGVTFPTGSTCSLSLQVVNEGAEQTADLYVLLDVEGEYWSYPGWQPLDVGLDHAEVTIPSGDASLPLIPEFTMPAVSPYGPLYFYAAMFEPGFLDLEHLVSNGAIYQFSIGE
jgi:hypothetical protein